jgi:hypothetical protein
LAAIEALGIVGFCEVEVKPFGPDQLYVAPVTAGVERLRGVLTQIGLLLDATGVAGVSLISTTTVPAALVQPFTVTDTAYEPESAIVAEGIVGFWEVEVNPFGPVQE